VPGNIASGMRYSRDTLRDLARRPLRLEKEERLDAIRRRDEEHRATLVTKHDWLNEPFPELRPSYGEVAIDHSVRDMELYDPTALIIIDEADGLRMASFADCLSNGGRRPAYSFLFCRWTKRRSLRSSASRAVTSGC
jgi:hypothetical protein